MELVKLHAGQADLTRIQAVPVTLFPENYALHLEAATLVETHLKCAFLLRENDRDIGSIVLFDNPDHYLDGERAMCVGYFHCPDDQKLANRLIDAARKEVRQSGVHHLIGPLNGTTWDSYRFKGADDPPSFFLEVANPAYYNKLFREAGFKEIKSYSSFLEKPIKPMPERVKKREQELFDAGIRIRTIDPNQYERDLSMIHELSHKCFKDNFLFTSHSFSDYIQKYSMLEGIARPELTLMAEDGDRLVGFVFMIDDIFCNTEKRIIFKTYASLSDERYHGLGTVLAQRLLAILLADGYESAMRSLIVDGSLSSRIAGTDNPVYRKYYLYGLRID